MGAIKIPAPNPRQYIIIEEKRCAGPYTCTACMHSAHESDVQAFNSVRTAAAVEI